MILSGKATSLAQKIYNWLRTYDRKEGYTRAEIAEYMGLKIQTVCGRIHTLKKSRLVRELDSRPDLFSKAIAKPLRIINRDTPMIRQEPMFEQK